MSKRPDFEQFRRVLANERPERPVLFELFLNGPLYERLAGDDYRKLDDGCDQFRQVISGFKNAGYDYATIHASDFAFPVGEFDQRETISLNAGQMIRDRESFKSYRWPDPGDYDFSRLERLADDLPAGMKLVAMGPGGVLENVIRLVGYEHLCYLTIDDPDLVEEIFDAVGIRLIDYYKLTVEYDTVGAIIGNDDWGFNTQTMLSPRDMERYVFPYHREIVNVAHRAGLPAILHSCGNLEPIMETIIDDLGYDAKHSFEDGIIPVEQAYEKWEGRIAILGGIDVDFICRSEPGEIKKRAHAMLDRTRGRGGYALGTGNSVPEYMPQDNFLALIATAREYDR